MLQRDSAKLIAQLAKEFPAVAITGPRQSGKTTLVRALFKTKPYINLEDLDQYQFAKEDPRGFLGQFQMVRYWMRSSAARSFSTIFSELSMKIREMVSSF